MNEGRVLIGQLFVVGGVDGDWLNVYVQGSGDDARFSVEGWGGTTAACPLVSGHPHSRWVVSPGEEASKEGPVDEEYIERDYAGFGQRERLTHYPSVDALLCQPYMLPDRWLLLKVRWLAKYPDVPIRDEQGNVLEREELTR